MPFLYFVRRRHAISKQKPSGPLGFPSRPLARAGPPTGRTYTRTRSRRPVYGTAAAVFNHNVRAGRAGTHSCWRCCALLLCGCSFSLWRLARQRTQERNCKTTATSSKGERQEKACSSKRENLMPLEWVLQRAANGLVLRFMRPHSAVGSRQSTVDSPQAEREQLGGSVEARRRESAKKQTRRRLSSPICLLRAQFALLSALLRLQAAADRRRLRLRRADLAKAFRRCTRRWALGARRSPLVARGRAASCGATCSQRVCSVTRGCACALANFRWCLCPLAHWLLPVALALRCVASRRVAAASASECLAALSATSKRSLCRCV